MVGRPEGTLLLRRHPVWPARALLVAFCGTTSGGCVSVRVSEVRPGAAPAGQCALAVSVFETRDAERSGALSSRRVVTELWRLDGQSELVHSSAEPRWSIDGLAAGRFELRADTYLDEDGTAHELSSTDHVRFALMAGDRATAHVVLKHPRRVLIGLAIGAGVALVVGTTLFVVNQTIAITSW